MCGIIKAYLPLLVSVLTLSGVVSEDILIRCDEFLGLNSLAGEPYCSVSDVRVSHNQDVKIQKYLYANDTKFMKFYDSSLLYLPFKLFDVFTNLKSLDVSSTEILDVSRNTFAAAHALSILNMSNNNITQITTSVFIGASSLLRLDLSHNQIEDINIFAFHGLNNLNKLQLSYNRISVLNKELFLENAYIEIIALDNNLIEYIEPEVFSHLRRIRDVNLAYNRIRQLHPNSFQNTYGLGTLVLSANQLSEFHLANKSVQLQLNLDRNNLTTISIDSTKRVRADHNNISTISMINTYYLEDLILANNNLTNIANITNLTSLHYLDLSNNPIGPLNITTFDKMEFLRELNLRHTGIRALAYGMFSKQKHLELLDLSFNNFTTLDLKLFVPYLAKLKSFFIDGNNLTEISGSAGFSVAFPSLLKLGISQNRFNCSYLHSILLPPQLAPEVELHIEPVAGNEESSHIRDISCISNVKQSLHAVEQELSEMTLLQRLMKQSMETMNLHEKKLVLYVLLMKIALLSMVCLLIGVVALGYWRQRRSLHFSTRDGSSIFFRSSNTVDVEH